MGLKTNCLMISFWLIIGGKDYALWVLNGELFYLLMAFCSGVFASWYLYYGLRPKVINDEKDN